MNECIVVSKALGFLKTFIGRLLYTKHSAYMYLLSIWNTSWKKIQSAHFRDKVTEAERLRHLVKSQLGFETQLLRGQSLWPCRLGHTLLAVLKIAILKLTNVEQVQFCYSRLIILSDQPGQPTRQPGWVRGRTKIGEVSTVTCSGLWLSDTSSPGKQRSHSTT